MFKLNITPIGYETNERNPYNNSVPDKAVSKANICWGAGLLHTPPKQKQSEWPRVSETMRNSSDDGMIKIARVMEIITGIKSKRQTEQ